MSTNPTADATPPGLTRTPEDQAERISLTLAWLLERGRLGDHASGAVVCRVEGDSLAVLTTTGDLPPVSRRSPVVLPLAAEVPLCLAGRDGRGVVMAERQAVVRRSPWLAAFAPDAASAVALPIPGHTGPIGVLGVTFDEPLRTADASIACLTVAADVLSTTWAPHDNR